MHIRICMDMYVCLCVVCMLVSLCVLWYVYDVHACIRMCFVCVCMLIYLCVGCVRCVCLYLCVYACLYLCVGCVCVYACLYLSVGCVCVICMLVSMCVCVCMWKPEVDAKTHPPLLFCFIS